MPAEATLDAPVTIDAMAELTALDDGAEKGATTEKAAPAPKPEKKSEAPKPVAEKKPETKPAVVEKKTPEVKPDDKKPTVVDPKAVKPDDSGQPKNFKELKDHLARAISERDELKAKHAELTNKLSTSAIPKEFEEKLTSTQAENKQ